MFRFQELWPEAIVVYMQGLPVVDERDPKGEKMAWQSKPGEVNDRDLKFFDETLKRVKKSYKVDEKRVYATGHSNGGGFA